MNAVVEEPPVVDVTRSATEQAAIVLLGLGEKVATQILRRMPAKAVTQLMSVLPTVDGVVESELDAVMENLLKEAEDAPLFSDKTQMNQVLRKALGQKRASELLQSATGEEGFQVLEKLLMLEPKLIHRLISSEHPQLQAVTLACLDPSKSAAVLDRMSDDEREDLVYRLAGLTAIPTSSLEAVAGLLDGLTAQEVSTYAVNGVGQLAEMLNHMDSDAGDSLLDGLRGMDDGLADQVSSLRFTFDHVLELEVEALRVLVDAADTDVLALALRGVAPNKQEYIYSCLGKRAASMLRDEVESGASVRASRVNEARVQLTALARRLGREGQIELVLSTEEMIN